MVIEVQQPAFSVNRNNPFKIFYGEYDRSCRPIMVQNFSQGMPTPKENEVLYRYKDRGCILRFDNLTKQGFRMKALESIKKGKLALESDTSKEELNKALKICFPEDGDKPSDKGSYYLTYNSTQWLGALTTTLPTIKVSQFLKLYQQDFPRVMMVRNKDYEPWRKVEVLYVDTEYYYTKSLRADNVLVGYKYARPIKVKEISRQQINNAFDCDEFKIIDK